MPEEENGEVKVSSEDMHEQPAAAAIVAASPDDAAAAAAVAQGSTALASPILVFLNSASGGKMGPKVLEKIRALIPEAQ